MQSMLVKANGYSKLARYSFNLSKHSISNGDRRLNSPANHQLSQVRHFSFVEYAYSTRVWISNSAAIDQLQKTLISVHDTIGLPWWLEICLTTVALRLVLLPFFVAEKKQAVKFDQVLLPEMKKKLEAIKETSRRKLQMRELRTEVQAMKWFNAERKKAKLELYQKHNLHPGKRIVLILTNFPVWMLTSFSVGHLCSQNLVFLQEQSVRDNVLHAAPQACFEGCLWFPNLTAPDPYCILPLLLMASMFTNIRYNRLVRKFELIDVKEKRLVSKALYFLIRASAIVLPACAAVAPSGLALFWTCNSMCFLGFNLLMNKPKVKQALGYQDKKLSVGFSDLLEDYKESIENIGRKFKK